MKDLEKLFFALLRSEVCGSPIEKLPRLSEGDLQALVELAERQDLSHLLYDALLSNGLLDEKDSAYKPLSKAQMLAIYREGEQTRVLSEVQSFLSDAGVPSLPLKGSVIRALYPSPWMRTAGDIDLLVQKEDIERAEALFVERGYKLYFRTPHDVSYTGETGVHIELHRTLSAKGEETGLYSPTLADAWSHLTFIDGKPGMPDDLFYFYHIFHMASHMKDGGCGVRPLLDLWLINHKTSGDYDARQALLKKEGFAVFAHNMERLSEFWFSGAPGDEFLETLSEYILLGGVYGTVDTNAYAKAGERGGRFRYRLSRVFLPYRELKERYPILEKHAILFPFVSVYRWFRALLPKQRKSVQQTLSGGETAEQKLGLAPDAFWSQLGIK